MLLQHVRKHVACLSLPAFVGRVPAAAADVLASLTLRGSRVSRGTCQKVVALVSSARKMRAAQETREPASPSAEGKKEEEEGKKKLAESGKKSKSNLGLINSPSLSL